MCCDCGGGTEYDGELVLPRDTTAPRLYRWSLNLSHPFLQLHFSEPVNATTLVPTALHITDRAPGGQRHRLTLRGGQSQWACTAQANFDLALNCAHTSRHKHL